jgi:hypothetical protein
VNKSTYGEQLLEEYLVSHGIPFEREPKLPRVSQLIDFVVDHPTGGKILLEVKDVVNPLPPRGFSTFNSYKPIREHIEEGQRKFKSTADYLCVLALAAPPGSFVNLNEPHVMLGAMYGDLGFRVPFDPRRGTAQNEEITSEFLVGDGKMVRRTRLQNTRIAALISVQEFAVWHLAMRKYMNTDDGRSRAERANDIHQGIAGLPEDIEAKATGITVWENGTAPKKLPQDLFRGEMDAWWEYSSGEQKLSFIGERRRALGADDRR